MTEEKAKRKYQKREFGPATIEEARHMARIKAVHAAPLWGMNKKMLSHLCLTGKVSGAVKIGRDYYVTPEAMDAIFTTKGGTDGKDKKTAAHRNSRGRGRYGMSQH